MTTATNENNLRRDITGLTLRNTLLEEKLQENQKVIEALQDSENQYRRLFESAKDGILIIDAETGTVVDVDPFLLALLGYTYDRVWGQFLWELGEFKDIAASKEAFITLQDNHYVRYENLPLMTRDGRSIEVEFVSNVYLVNGKKIIQCNIRDITERRNADRVLEESEAKMRSILDNIKIGVVLISPGMEVLEVNQRMRDWFPDLDTGRKPICYKVFNDPPRQEVCNKCPTIKTLQDGTVHEETTQILRAGALRSHRIVTSPVHDSSGEIQAVIKMVEDITDRLSLESQLMQAQKLESVGRLAGGVAHDFNNMLSVILGYAELALEKVAPSKPVHDDLQEIIKAARRSTEITRQLLAFARKQTIAPNLIDLNDTVTGILKMLTRFIGEDIELNWLPGNSLWPVMMDPSQLDQILMNLCVNARDAIKDVGKITLETDWVSYDAIFCHQNKGFIPGEFVRLSVGDSGCGMDKDIQEKIFEPFFTTKAVGRGSGLGLSTVYGIVKQNNGFINVYSEPGKGSIFRIYLPCHKGDNIDPWREGHKTIIPGQGETILVVEDEAVILKMTRTMLEKLGYTVLTAGTKNEAMGMVKTHSGEISLLITDVVMPEMNGRDLAQQLKLLEPDLNCLFMSGYTSDSIAHLGVLDKGVCFIQKPFSMIDLALKVNGALGKK
ncbi:MAG: PAS domain S-box protein [Pseudomonadota bacterium]